jgi:hypothetical protein
LKARAFLLVAAAALLIGYLRLRGGPPAVPAPGSVSRVTPPEPRRVGPERPFPPRDPFRFGDVDRPGAPGSQPPAPIAVPVPSPSGPEPPAVRLVGFVRRPGGLVAALSVMGEVILVGPGETASGFSVLAVDEEQGVRLRTPEGREMILVPEP